MKIKIIETIYLLLIDSKFLFKFKNTIIKNGVKIYRVFSWRKGIHDCGFRGAYTYLLSAALKLLSLRKNSQFDIVHYFQLRINQKRDL